MQAQVRTGDAGAGGDSQLTAGAGVQPQPFLCHPAGNFSAEESLAGVVDIHSPAGIGEGRVKRVLEVTGAGPEIGFGDNEQRRTELSGEG